MLLAIYTTLVLLSLLLLAVGYYREAPWMVLTSYVFLFLLGLVLTGVDAPVLPASGVDFKNGENTTTTYVYSNSTLSSTEEVQVDNYTNYSNKTIGLFFALSFVFAFILTLTEYKVRRN